MYDGLLIVALLMIYTAIAMLFTHGKAVTWQNAGAWTVAYRAGLVLVIAAYFVSNCALTGHTLGMRAWRLRLMGADGQPASLGPCLGRFCLGFLCWLPLGLGVLWLYLDREGLALQDRLSKTRPIVLAAR
jgi:uncharacterized RDD family membrane protein YckC